MNSNAYPPTYLAEAPDWATSWGEDEYGVWAEFELNGIRQRMRWIEPGTFLMGSPEADAERSSDEVQHGVELTEGFWMADTACTQALWQAVMGSNPSGFKDDEQGSLPVETVSWDGCQGFLSRVEELAPELALRLPTEAEWEYACRAGTTTLFSFGENITTELVNYRRDYPYAGGANGEHRMKTVPVGSLPPNPWGLYEMHGNVWEWCEDWSAPYSAEPATDPRGPEGGDRRVLRGGSWHASARYSRSAYRASYRPEDGDASIGFRFVRGR